MLKAVLYIFLTIIVLIAGQFPEKSDHAISENGSTDPGPKDKSVAAVKSIDIPILMYHHFSEEQEDWGEITVSPDKFRKDMAALIDAGYTTVLPRDVVGYLKEGDILPDKPIIVTIDDGYYSNYEYAFPILKELNMKAVIYIVGSRVGMDEDPKGNSIIPRFSVEEAKEMYESGLVSIQPHSYDMHDISQEDAVIVRGVEKYEFETEKEYESRIIEDTKKVIELIEKEIGDHCVSYSYPFGVYNDTVQRILKEKFGIEMTLTVEPGIETAENGLMLSKRINVPYDRDPITLLDELNRKR